METFHKNLMTPIFIKTKWAQVEGKLSPSLFRRTDIRGGGVIIIKANTGEISGRIMADGHPISPIEDSKDYEAGSGGYIYINCKTS